MKKNEAFLIIRDKDTGKIKRVYRKENRTTLFFDAKLTRLDNNIDYNNIILSRNKTFDFKGNYVVFDYNNNTPNGTKEDLRGDGTLLSNDIIYYNDNTNSYLEVSRRFQPLSTVQSYQAIYLGGDISYRISYGGAYQPFVTNIALASFCTQSTTEVLDVYYRIYFNNILTPTTNKSSELKVLNGIKNMNIWTLYNRPSSYTIIHYFPAGYPMLNVFYQGDYINNIEDYYNYLIVPTRDDQSSGSTNVPNAYLPGVASSDIDRNKYFKYRMYLNETTSTNIGYWIAGYTMANRAKTTILSLIDNNDLPSKYIQPLHNHSKNAIAPFLDVNFLATGQGSINLSSSSAETFPNFYRIEISRTGDIGTSSYYFRKRKIFSFLGNTYEEAGAVIPFLRTNYGNDLPAFGYSNMYKQKVYGLTYNYAKPEHGEQLSAFIKGELTGNKLIFHSHLDGDVGFTILDIATGEYLTFDNSTFPNFNISNSIINDIDVDSLDNIWVATADGIYKIENYNNDITRTITRYNSIGSFTYQNVLRITVGANDNIYAFADGALLHTNDGGLTWTYYNETTTPSFVVPDLTNNNWNNIFAFVASKVNGNEVGILYKRISSSTYYQFAWWDNNTKSVTLGPADTTKTTLRHAEEYYDFKNIFKTDDRLGVWFEAATNIYPYGFTQLEFGTGNYRNLNVNGGYYYKPNKLWFVYDYFGNPYILANEFWDGSTTNYNITYYNIVSKNNGFISKPTTATDLVAKITYLFNKPGNLKNVAICFYKFNGYTYAKTNNEYYKLITNFINDPLSYKYSFLEEYTYDKYSWNGSQWVKNYFQPAQATDATGTPVPADNAPRHNFDIEDHRFTGRSMIDISVPYGNKNTTGNMTFVATVIPEDKPTAADTNAIIQSQISTLYSYTDNSTNTKFSFYWNKANTYADITFNDGVTDYSFGIAPADNILHRVVLSIDTTNNIARCYVDGVQLGTDVSFTNPIDLTNPNGSAKVYIGADIIKIYGKDFIEDFYKGQMSNVQIWDGLWTSTDVTNDYGNTVGVISSPSTQAGTMLLRYELNEVLNETKLTHTSQDNLIDTISISFQNGSTSPAFVSTDYYTFINCRGIFKDNATSYQYVKYINTKPTYKQFDVEDYVNNPGVNTNVVVPSTGGYVLEGAAMSNFDGLTPGPGNTYKAIYSGNGITDAGNSFITQYIDGDGYLEFKIGSKNPFSGYISYASLWDSIANVHYEFAFNGSNVLEVRIGGTVVFSGTYSITDLLKIERVGNIVNFYQNNTIIHSASISSNRLTPKTYVASKTQLFIYDINIYYNRPAYMLDMGSSLAQTGKFYPNFHMIDNQGITVNLDGVPAVIRIEDNQRMDQITPPAPSEVVIIPQIGIMWFNSADAGKVVTAEYYSINNEA